MAALQRRRTPSLPDRALHCEKTGPNVVRSGQALHLHMYFIKHLEVRVGQASLPAPACSLLVSKTPPWSKHFSDSLQAAGMCDVIAALGASTRSVSQVAPHPLRHPPPPCLPCPTPPLLPQREEQRPLPAAGRSCARRRVRCPPSIPLGQAGTSAAPARARQQPTTRPRHQRLGAPSCSSFSTG